MRNQHRCETRHITFMGLALTCLLFAIPTYAANPEYVAVQVTFVDPVEIQAAEQGIPTEDPANLLITDTPRQTSSVVVDSSDGSFDVTFSYQ